MRHDYSEMKTVVLLIFLTFCCFGYTFARKRHKSRNKRIKEELWRRHYEGKKHEIKGQNPHKNNIKDVNGDFNLTKIFDHVSKFEKVKTETGAKRSLKHGKHGSFRPGLWQFDTAGNNEVKLLVSDVSRTAADIVKSVRNNDHALVTTGKDGIVGGVRRSGCINDNNCMLGLGGMNGMNGMGGMGGMGGINMMAMGHGMGHGMSPFQQELFVPGGEKTYQEPMTMLHQHDAGPFHHFENGGNPMIGAMTHGSNIVTHQIDYQTSPRQVFMHGIEKTQHTKGI